MRIICQRTKKLYYIHFGFPLVNKQVENNFRVPFNTLVISIKLPKLRSSGLRVRISQSQFIETITLHYASYVLPSANFLYTFFVERLKDCQLIGRIKFIHSFIQKTALSKNHEKLEIDKTLTRWLNFPQAVFTHNIFCRKFG